MRNTKQATLRPATEKEIQQHDAFVAGIERMVNKAKRQGEPIEVVAKRVQHDLGYAIARYGWVRAAEEDPLMICEETVWEAIQVMNPVPDPLETMPKELVAQAHQGMLQTLSKFTLRPLA